MQIPIYHLVYLLHFGLSETGLRFREKEKKAGIAERRDVANVHYYHASSLTVVLRSPCKVS